MKFTLSIIVPEGKPDTENKNGAEGVAHPASQFADPDIDPVSVVKLKVTVWFEKPTPLRVPVLPGPVKV